MRFKVDENLPAEVTSLLREAGYDALSIFDHKMIGSADDHIAEVCKAEARAILTLDLDFADLRAYPPEDYFGITVMRLRTQDKLHVLSVMERLLPQFEREALAKRLWVVDEFAIRIFGGSR